MRKNVPLIAPLCNRMARKSGHGDTAGRLVPHACLLTDPAACFLLEIADRLVDCVPEARNQMNRSFRCLLMLGLLAAATLWVPAQYRTAREAEGGSLGEPQWTVPEAFRRDVFTFVRIKYHVDGDYGFGHTPPEDRWMIDFPEADLNFSYRLQQLTSLKVNPDGRVLEITDKELFEYPFIYIVEAGRLTFRPEEVTILRQYLLNGGFLMVDDFWGERDWANFDRELHKVFPDREAIELGLEHPIFHCVFDLKERPQIPGEPHFSQYLATGRTWEREDAKEVHYRGIYDDKGRLMVMICHNTDLGDGWEREGDNEGYFHSFSEKSAYPLGINIVYYAMTH